MRLLLMFLIIFSLLVPQAYAAFITAVDPSSGRLAVIDGAQPYLQVSYFDWGPGWSGVKRLTSVVEDEPGNKAGWTIRSTMNNNVGYRIDAIWSQPQKDTILLDAALTPDGNSKMIMSQFSLTMGRAFTNTEAQVTFSDGRKETFKVPFQRGKPGSGVSLIEFKDKAGRVTVVTFAAPTAIPSDRGDARIVIAQEQITEGKIEKLKCTIKLPEPTSFASGAQSATKLSDNSHWYEFSPQGAVSAKSEWNLSSWLETPAGKHGRIAQQGDQLIYHNQPIKLWGVNNCYATCAPDKKLADKRADFYAALGINAVRLHKYAQGPGWAGILTENSSTEYDAAKLDQMDYYVAALKKRGIYTKLSPVFMMELGEGDRAKVPFMDELGKMSHDRLKTFHGMFYLSPELQGILLAQVTTLLNHTNPYTQMTYADDPAIAYLEIFNEDSTLWGGVTRAMSTSKTLRARGGAMFAKWLKKKYKTESQFEEAWGKQAVEKCGLLPNQKLPQDESWTENRIYPAGNPWFFDPSNLETSQKPYRRRLLDTMTFLFELQNNVYSRYVKGIRKAGYEGQMITSNWQAGRMMSHFYNLHSDAKYAGTIDRHNYFGGAQRGSAVFTPNSMLTAPGSGPLSSSLQQVKGRAFMLSEWIHVFPNEWGVEGPAILGAYGMGLQGWDVSYAFQNSDDGTFASRIGLSSWEATTPQFLGIFPAVSRQVLRGDVKESSVVHERHVNLSSLNEGKVGFDESTQQQWDIKTFTSNVFPAEALAVAKSVVDFTNSSKQTTPTKPFDLSPYRNGDTLTSSTKQLRWTAGKSIFAGYIEINTPGTQAVVGFAKGETIQYRDVTITPRSHYGAIYLSAQAKNGTIATDQGVLIIAISRARNKGSIVVADSIVISKGKIERHKPVGPVVMEPVLADIVLARKGNPIVHILDHTGVKTGKTLPIKNGRFTIDTGRDASPYYLISY